MLLTKRLLEKKTFIWSYPHPRDLLLAAIIFSHPKIVIEKLSMPKNLLPYVIQPCKDEKLSCQVIYLPIHKFDPYTPLSSICILLNLFRFKFILSIVIIN